jgi:hypothetical protein
VDVKQRLRELGVSLEAADGYVSTRVDVCRAARAEIEKLESVQQCAPLLKEQARRLRAAVADGFRYANAAGDLIDLDALAGDLEEVRRRILGEIR